jgi:hypothetical protein
MKGSYGHSLIGVGAGITMICAMSGPAVGLEVYVDTNFNPAASLGSQLYNIGMWSETASNLDGIYYRSQGMARPPGGVKPMDAKKSFVNVFREKKFILEFPDTQINAYTQNPVGANLPMDVQVMRAAGIEKWSAMTYWTKRPDSTPLISEISQARKFFGLIGRPNQLFVLNTRAWTRNTILQDELAKGMASGFSLEWAPYRMPDKWIIDEVAAAIKWAVEKERVCHLLVNAENSTNFLSDIQRTFNILYKNCPGQLRSKNVKFVLANYEHSTTIQFVPEKDSRGNPANTLTGAALWVIRAADAAGLRAAPQPGPYRDIPQPVPGIVQCEDFDTGGNGLGYVDTTKGNVGDTYRLTEDVDIQKAGDAGGGHYVGWTRAGENLRYTVDVIRSGVYRVELRVASKGLGGTVHLEADGSDVSGPIRIPNTGGWQAWQTVTVPNVSLRKGTQTLRLIMDKEGSTGGVGNLNWVRFVAG